MMLVFLHSQEPITPWRQIEWQLARKAAFCSLFSTFCSLLLESVRDAEGNASANIQVHLAGSRRTFEVVGDYLVQQRVVDISARVQNARVDIQFFLAKGTVRTA